LLFASSRPSTPAIEFSSTKELENCFGCEQQLDEKKYYCGGCYKSIQEENLKLIDQKISRLKEVRKNVQVIREEKVVATILERKKIPNFQIQKDLCHERIKDLKQRISNLQKSIKQDRLEIEKLKIHNQERKMNLINSKTKLETLFNSMNEKETSSLRFLQEENRKFFEKLAKYRKYLIAEFFSFFPLNPHSERECAIINIKIPNSSTDWANFPTEVMAAALGYLVHMLNIIIMYLDLCLPYKMKFFGSHSLIWRDGSSRKYILNNNNERDFKVALEMLNWNVIHLCIYQGVNINLDKYEEILLNLLAVIRSPYLGIEGPHAEEEKIKKGRKRTMSISSLSMPSVSGLNSSLIKEPNLSPINEREKIISSKKDEEDFIVIQSLSRANNNVNVDSTTIEGGMFVDNI